MAKVITDVWSKKGVRITVESFGRTLTEATEELYSGIAYGVEKYGWSVENPNPTPAPVEQVPVQKVTKGPIEKKPLQQAEGQINTMTIEKVKVTPKPEGKVELSLFGQGHAFADMHYTAPVAELLEKMAATNIDWQPEDFALATEYRCVFVVKWKQSQKLNTNGNPYRDIVEFLPAGAK